MYNVSFKLNADGYFLSFFLNAIWCMLVPHDHVSCCNFRGYSHWNQEGGHRCGHNVQVCKQQESPSQECSQRGTPEKPGTTGKSKEEKGREKQREKTLELPEQGTEKAHKAVREGSTVWEEERGE